LIRREVQRRHSEGSHEIPVVVRIGPWRVHVTVVAAGERPPFFALHGVMLPPSLARDGGP
jgi:hypothetical protein